MIFATASHPKPGTATSVGSRRSSPLRFWALAIAPNVVFALAAQWTLSPRAIVNLDYLAFAVAAVWIPRRILLFPLAVALLLDLAYTMSPIFNIEAGDLPAMLFEVRHYDAAGLIAVIVCVVATGLVGNLLLPNVAPPAARLRATIRLVAAGLIVLSADAINGSNALFRRDEIGISVNFATSPLVQTFRTSVPAARAMAHWPDMPVVPRVPSASATLRTATLNGDSAIPKKIVLVLVESLGFSRDTAMQHALLRTLPTERLRARYDVQTGTIPFRGATTSAEFRELCGIGLNHRMVSRVSLEGCLPEVLRARGYETVAYHGFHGALFGRRSWYPRLGFTRLHFRDELQRDANLAECGSLFRGICDTTMVRILAAELRRAPERRQFLYWVSLTSHFPLERSRTSDHPECAPIAALGADTICGLHRLLAEVLRGVGTLAADTSAPAAWYVLVGDHAPQMLGPESAAFSRDEVTFIALRPKATTTKVGSLEAGR